MLFVDSLDRYPELSGSEETGQKILNIIKSWNNFIDFDKEHYFHSRTKNKNGRPYTRDEMERAPKDRVGYGRYNHPYESFYYFSDTRKGAETEVKIHNKNADVQTVRLTSIRSIKIM